MIISLFKFVFLLLGVLVSVAFLTLLERKFLGLVGLRLGPNKVSVVGILQPIFDAIKLMNKQINFSSNFYFFFYYLTSSLILGGSLFLWVVLFFDPNVLSLKFSVLILMLILSLNSLNFILSGWSTFSKYSLMGSIRTLSQLISYEASLYLCLFFLIYFWSSFSFFSFNYSIFSSTFIFIPYCFYIWVPCVLAELNRTPYDFSEGESELVSGFNTEFGCSSFTLIFLGEYSMILLFSFLTSLLFFSSYFLISFYFMLFFVIWIRSVLPRFRFDKLMSLSWKFFVPFLTLAFILYYVVI